MRLLATVLVGILLNFTVLAHVPDDAYVYLDIDSDAIELVWDISFADIEAAWNEIHPPEDQLESLDGDSVIAMTDQITSFLIPQLRLSIDQEGCELAAISASTVSYTNGNYFSLSLLPECRAGASLSLEYTFMFAEDKTHRGVLLVNRNTQHTARELFLNHKRVVELDTSYANTKKESDPVEMPDSIDRPASASFEVATNTGNSGANLKKRESGKQQGTIAQESVERKQNLPGLFRSYLSEGAHHILIGYDHIVFLLTLLLPTVMIRRRRSRVAVESIFTAIKEAVKIVSMFTVAHSITLSLAVLGVVNFPGYWIEIAIAVSVFIAALDNIYPVFMGPRWLLTFFFGLAHGFGFASALSDLGLEQGRLFLSLFGFNLGVELGQLLIVMLVFPLLYYFRKASLYETLVIRAGSLVVMAIAIYWVIQRVGLL